jgi:hypothetical protein
MIPVQKRRMRAAACEEIPLVVRYPKDSRAAGRSWRGEFLVAAANALFSAKRTVDHAALPCHLHQAGIASAGLTEAELLAQGRRDSAIPMASARSQHALSAG